MSIYDEKIQFVADLIILKLEALKNTMGKEVGMGFFQDDIDSSGLSMEKFFAILCALKNKKCISDIKITDCEEGGEDIGHGWTPYYALPESMFPGFYVIKVYKDFEKRYRKHFGTRIKKEITQCALPKGTIWEDIKIKFVNKYDIEIFIKDKFFAKATNKDLGCYRSNISDDKDNSDEQWKFLQKLSTSKGQFELTIFTDNKDKDRYKKYKEKLSNNLRDYFAIEEDPFYDYIEKEMYQTKFIIEPVPDLRRDGELYGCKDNITDYTKEETDARETSHRVKHEKSTY